MTKLDARGIAKIDGRPCEKHNPLPFGEMYEINLRLDVGPLKFFNSATPDFIVEMPMLRTIASPSSASCHRP
jgi:hypothetical protein